MAKLALGFDLEMAQAEDDRWPASRGLGLAVLGSAVLWASLIAGIWLLWGLV